MNKIKKDLQQVYNNISQEFSASRVFPWEELEIFIPHIKDGDKILDLGCGNGRLIKALQESKKDFDYLGVDFSDGLIDRAREQFPDKKFELNDISKVDFEANSFDTVFVIATFHHLPSKKERQELLNKINIWLKPGGYLIMTNWNLWQRKYMKHYFKKFWLKKSWNDFFVSWQMYSGKSKKFWRYYHSFSTRELESLLKKTGFKLKPKGVYKTKWNINCFVQK